MSARSIIITAAIVCLALGCKTTKKKPQTDETLVLNTGEVFPRLYAAKISKLVIERQGAPRVVLEQAADQSWHIAEPIRSAVDDRAVRFALGELEHLEWVEPPTTRTVAEWAAAKATPADVVTLTITHDGRELPPLHLAQTRVARVGTRADLYTIHHVSHYTFDRELRFWRDRLVARFEPTTVDAVELILQDGATTRRALIRRTPAGPPPDGQQAAEPDVWTLAEATPKLESADADVMNMAFRRMIYLEAQDVSEVPRARAGLDAPRARIILHAGTARTEIRLGADAPDGAVYVGDGTGPRVLVLSQADADLIAPNLWR